MRRVSYLQGAVILTLTNLITGAIAFIYRIFLTRTIGSEGIGIYQLVLPLYYFFITIVSSGLITTISKLIVENRVKGNYSNIFKTIRIGLILSGIWSSILTIFIYYNADILACYLLKDARTTYSIMIFSPAIMFIALSAVLKGYFYGVEKVSIPALIDIIEKLIRLIFLIFITNYFIDYGIEFICAGAMLAMTCGEILSLILLFLSYKYKRLIIPNNKKPQKVLAIIKSILFPLIPLSISGAIESILDMIDAILIPEMLIKSGFSKQNALSAYGELTGMVIPLLYFPIIIISSLSITLIPSIAYSNTSKNQIALNKKCNDSMIIASIVGFASTIAFLTYPNELCQILYKSPATGKLLFWSAIPCIFEYYLFIIMAILNGLGYQNKVMECSLSNIFIITLSILFVMPIKTINIYAYIIGFALSSSYVVIRGIFIIRNKSNIRFEFKNIIIKPLFSAIIMFFSIKLLNNYFTLYSFTRYNMIASYIAGLIIYFIVLFSSKTISAKQLLKVFNVKAFLIL